MTEYAELLCRAYRDGRCAEIGSDNPYCGQGAPARLWRRGYRANLVHMLETSPAALEYEAAQAALMRAASEAHAAWGSRGVSSAHTLAAER